MRYRGGRVVAENPPGEMAEVHMKSQKQNPFRHSKVSFLFFNLNIYLLRLGTYARPPIFALPTPISVGSSNVCSVPGSGPGTESLKVKTLYLMVYMTFTTVDTRPRFGSKLGKYQVVKTRNLSTW